MKRNATTAIVLKKKAPAKRQKFVLLSSLEKKNIDTGTSAAFDLLLTGVFRLVNGCPVGTGPIDRIGRRIMMQSIEVKLSIGSRSSVSDTAANSPVRVVVVYDRQTNGALASGTDIFQFDEITGSPNLANAKRFKFLGEFFINQVGTVGGNSAYRRLFIDLTNGGKTQGLETTYNLIGASGTVAQINTGSIIVGSYQMSMWGLVIPSHLLTTRVRYIDA